MEVSPQMCISGRDLGEPRLSPDGQMLTYVARASGAAAIWMVELPAGRERQLTTWPPPIMPRAPGGGCHAWMPDGSGIVYAAVDGGLWLQPIPGGAPRVLAPALEDRPAQAPAVAPDGSAVAYLVDQAEVHLADLRRQATPSRIDAGDAGFCFDPDISLVVAEPGPGGPDGAGELRICWQGWSAPDMPWDAAAMHQARISRIPGVDGDRWEINDRSVVRGAGAIQQPRQLADGRITSVRDDTGWLNVWLDDRPLVPEPHEHAGPSWGPGQRSYAVSPDARRVAFTRNEGGFGRLCVAELAPLAADRPAVHEIARGVHRQLDWRGDRLVALRSGARTPTEIVVYETGGRRWTRQQLAIGPVLAWDHVDLPEPELVEIPHDGVMIPARHYRYGKGRMLCWIHGGPTDQWHVEFLPRVAYWWSQGWDVLVPDPRGSTGHGRAFQQALRGGWGRLDVDDTAAVLRAVQASGVATPNGTVAVGGSSGGMTVLGLLADHPGLLAAGIASYPVSDPAELAERSHRFEAHYTDTLIGPASETELLRERAPLHRAERISRPVLLFHGEADPVVPVEQSRALAEAIEAAGGDVELHLFAGEGHGFRDPTVKLAEYELMGQFLDRVAPAGQEPGSGRAEATRRPR